MKHQWHRSGLALKWYLVACRTLGVMLFVRGKNTDLFLFLKHDIFQLKRYVFAKMRCLAWRRDLIAAFQYLQELTKRTKPGSSQRCVVVEQESVATN